MKKLIPAYRLPEDIRVVAVIIAELEFGDVERQVLSGYFMECTNDTALEDRPETFNRIRVDRTNDVLALAVVNDAVREVFVERAIADPLISAKQADFLGYRTTHKGREGVGTNVIDDPRDNLAFA